MKWKQQRGGFLGLLSMLAITVMFAGGLQLTRPADDASAQTPTYDLSLSSKTSSTGDVVAVGEQFRWSVTMAITGTPPASTAFTLNDTIPAAFDVVSVIEDDRIDCVRSGSGGRVFVCSGATTAGDALAGTAQHVLLRFDVVPNGTSCGDQTNLATLAEAGSNANNNAVSDTITVQCTGSLTITKDTEPETTGVSFDFDGSFEFQLADDGSISLTGLAAGTYTITEDEADGYRLVDIDCSAGAKATVSLASETLTLTLSAGENVECTFTNEQIETAPPAAPVDTPPIQGGADLPQQEVASQVQPQQQVIVPPNTGDGGLRDASDGSIWLITLGLIKASGILLAARTFWTKS